MSGFFFSLRFFFFYFCSCARHPMSKTIAYSLNSTKKGGCLLFRGKKIQHNHDEICNVDEIA